MTRIVVGVEWSDIFWFEWWFGRERAAGMTSHDGIRSGVAIAVIVDVGDVGDSGAATDRAWR